MMKNKKRFKKYIYILLGVLILFEIIILVTPKIIIHTNNATKEAPNTLEKYSLQIIEVCKDSQYRPVCYDKEIPKLMEYISMEDAFHVTWLIQNSDPEYHYCHILGHELSAQEVLKDPKNWKDVINRCPSGMCSNGCLHGGFQERFRGEKFTDEQMQEITEDLYSLCEKRENWNPTGLEQSSCYHALGHLTMYITNADLNKSIAMCDEITGVNDHPNLTQICYDGVFMQIFQPLEPEDFALVEGKQPTKDEVVEFCDKFTDKKKASCLSESWPLYYDTVKDPEKVQEFCNLTEEEERDRCYNVAFFVITAQFKFDLDRLENYCSKVPGSVIGKCFANASARMIETDYRNIEKSVDLCNRSKVQNASDACFVELVKYSTFNFHGGSDEYFHLCNNMPEPWNDRCLEKHTPLN